MAVNCCWGQVWLVAKNSQKCIPICPQPMVWDHLMNWLVCWRKGWLTMMPNQYLEVWWVGLSSCPTFQLRSDFRGRVVPFGNPVAFAFVSRVPLETAYWDGTSAPSNAAPYMRYATTGAAQLLKPPIIHRVEPLSAVEITARIADASGFSIDRRAAGARNTLQPWKLFFLTWGSPYCPTPRTFLLQLVIILPGNVGSTIYARCSLPVCT